MFVIVILLIILFIILSISKNYYEYEEYFTVNCQTTTKYTPTCDKRQMYNILANLEGNLAKMNYKLNKLQFDSSQYDFNKMYLWYQEQLKQNQQMKSIGSNNAQSVKGIIRAK